MTATASKVVQVYTRLNEVDENAREISFRIPQDIPAVDILKDLGFAIDGNQALITIVDEKGNPLAEQLRETQIEVMAFLEAKGYETQFMR